MQNLTKYSNRQYVASRRMYRVLNKYERFTKSIAHLNLRCTNWSRNDVYSLTIPASYHTLRASWPENRLDKRCLSSKELGRTRYFSRKSTNPTDKSKSSKQSQDDSDNKKSNENKETVNMLLQKMGGTLLSGVVLYYFLKLSSTKQDLEMYAVVSWHEFVYHMLTKGEVKEIVVNPDMGKVLILLHDGAIVKGKRSPYRKYLMNIVSMEDFEEKVRKVENNLGIKPGDGVQIIYERTSTPATAIVYVLVLAALVMILMSLRKKIKFTKPWEFLTHMKRAKFTLVDPLTGHGKGVRFKDVAGLKEAKIEIMEFVDYLKHPERYETLGAKIPKGALLLGPPGCGKTLLAKAVATEANVPFLSMNGSEFIELLGGLGPARVRNLFEEGKKRAPSIIYIDEIDAIGKRRSTSSVPMSNDETERTLNQLLVEMDGMMSRADVLILASTNRAEVLDKALLRPGRFDRHILIDLPTLEERKQIFDYHLEKLSLKDKPSKYSSYLAYLTPGFSGADIANVCNESALHAATEKKKAVEGIDLMYAIDRTIGGTQKKTNTLTPSMKRVVAYHESGHALVGWLLKHTNALLKVTIVPRTNLKLGFSQYTPSNQKLHSKEELFEKMCMMLGGRAAENLVFNQISSGASDDLKKVTKLAYLQVQQYGMCPSIGLMSYDQESLTTKTKKMYSKRLANLMDVEARRLIAEAYESTNKLILNNKDKLDKLAEALLEKETLSYVEVEELIGPPPFGKKQLIEPIEFETTVPLTEPSQPAQEAPM